MGGRSSHVCGSKVGVRGDLGVFERLLMRFWVAGVGLGSPGAAVLLSSRQRGAGRTGHHISHPNPWPPMLCGAIFPP